MFDPPCPLPVPEDKPFISHLSPVFMGEIIRSNVLYTFYAYGLTYPKNGSSHKGDDLNLFYESMFFFLNAVIQLPLIMMKREMRDFVENYQISFPLCTSSSTSVIRKK